MLDRASYRFRIIAIGNTPALRHIPTEIVVEEYFIK
jgi:hypothetical protein